jgi:hypothetical protein
MQPEIKPSGFKRKGVSLGTAMNQWQTKGLSDCSNENQRQGKLCLGDTDQRPWIPERLKAKQTRGTKRSQQKLNLAVASVGSNSFGGKAKTGQ